MNASPVLSIVIVSFNTKQLLDRCLKAVFASCGTFELDVVVVDNASVDGSPDMVATAYPRVRLIRNPVGRFYAPAANQGAAVARGSKLLFLNSDIELPPHALELLMRPQVDDVAAVVPLLRGEDGEPQLVYTFRKLPKTRDLIANLLFIRQLSRFLPMKLGWDSDPPPLDRDTDVEQPSGACMMIDATIFRALGCFDERLALWFNDVDLCKRIQLAGYRIRYLHDVEVKHAGGASIERMTPAERCERLYADTLSYVMKWEPGAALRVRAAVVANLGLRSLSLMARPRQVRPWFAALPALIKSVSTN